MELALNPYGRLRIIGGFSNKTLQQAFLKSESEGFLGMVHLNGAKLNLNLKYWHSFANEAIRLRTQDSEWLEHQAIESYCSGVMPNFFKEQCLKAPPFKGKEYLNPDLLRKFWNRWNSFLNNQQKKQELTGRNYLQLNFPRWDQIGKVTFHLAENKKSEKTPFAFMVTFSTGLNETTGKVIHQPISRALQESAVSGDREKLVRLLEPVRTASHKCDWLSEGIQNKKIFKPQAWTVREAYQFLSHVKVMEESGLTVRTPNWWKGKSSPRAKVSVVIDTEKKATLGLGDMLRFSLSYSIEGRGLTQEEVQQILEANEGLVNIRGEWIEANPEQLKAAMSHWNKASQMALKHGLGFNEAMRLLSGSPIGSSRSEEELDEENQFSEWVEIVSGDFLKKSLAGNRQESHREFKKLSQELQAKLRPYQEKGVDWLWRLTRLGFGLCLADDMGLGKTIQIISLLILIHRPAKKSSKDLSIPPSILVVPASLLGNWYNELKRFAPNLRVMTLHPSEMKVDFRSFKKEMETLLVNHEVVITTYGQMVRVGWITEFKWSLVCLDEAQAIKNSGTRQSRFSKKLIGKYRIALTGTPIENRLGDLWSLFDFINPRLLGTSNEFKTYLSKIQKEENPDFGPLRKLVQPYILRRLKTDKTVIDDLPDKIERKIYCSLTAQQASSYQEMVKELLDLLKESKEAPQKRRALVLTFLMKFKQLCNHYSQYSGDMEYNASGSGKFKQLQEITEEIYQRQEKVLVFTQFKEMVQPLANYLETIFKEKGFTLDGSRSVKQRQEMVETFQKDNGPPFFILSIQAGGTGLNLTHACHVVHFDRWWNPAVEDQATDRAFRIGQKQNVIVHKFICRGTIEEKIDKMISEKRELSNKILEGNSAERGLTEMTDEELMKFVALDPLKAVRGN